jgi:hypothetical protein
MRGPVAKDTSGSERAGSLTRCGEAESPFYELHACVVTHGTPRFFDRGRQLLVGEKRATLAPVNRQTAHGRFFR